MPPTDERELSRAILKYLKENPEGMDTLEGISRFWVLLQKIETHVGEVEAVVTKLISQGYLKDRPLRDASGEVVEHYFQLNPSRLKEIEKLLERKDT